MADYPYPDEATTVKAYQKRVHDEYVAVGRTFPDPNDADAFRHFTRYGYSCRTMPEPQAADKHIRELRAELNPSTQPGPGQPTNRPLVGPLRIQDKLFRDDTGWRRVLFCSWFPALRILRDNSTEFYRQIDAIAAANYQGIRIFLAVGGWMPYWDGKEVVPIRFQKATFDGNHLRPLFNGPWLDAWPEYDDLLRTLLRACVSRKLRLHVTCGDMQIIDRDGTQEIPLHQRLSRICAEEGGTHVIGVVEVTNEFPLNRYGGDSPQSLSQMGRVIDVWQSAIPGVLTMQGAIPQNEEIASLDKACTHGSICAVHVTRDPVSKAFKRVFGLIYQEGAYRKYPKAFWEGEHLGPGDDSYQRCDDPASLTGCYAAHAITGQGSVRFQGAAVRFNVPLEHEWGFAELPAILAQFLPEDIATWEHGSDQHGGIEYWWKGNDFRTFTHVDWNNTPPRPIASWTCYPSGQSGTGTPPSLTGLLVGTFQ
jgi:hypothetical protein